MASTEMSPGVGNQNWKEALPRTYIVVQPQLHSPCPPSRTNPIMRAPWHWDPVGQVRARAPLPMFGGERVQCCSFSPSLSSSISLKFFVLISLLSLARNSFFFFLPLFSSPSLTHCLPGVERFLLHWGQESGKGAVGPQSLCGCT